MRFTCYGLSQQRLPRPWRAYEKGSLGDLPTELRVLIGVLEEVDDFLDLFLGFVQAGDIVEGHRSLFLLVELSFALADVEDASAHSSSTATRGPAEDEDPEDRYDDEGKDIGHQRNPARTLLLVGDFGDRPAGVVGFGEAIDRGDLRGDAVVDALLLPP